MVGKDWQEFTKTDQRYERPAEVPDLIGDASKAKRVLGWEPTVRWRELARIMVEADLESAAREARVRGRAAGAPSGGRRTPLLPSPGPSGRRSRCRALVAQGIEQWPPEPCAQVRILPRAPFRFGPDRAAAQVRAVSRCPPVATRDQGFPP